MWLLVFLMVLLSGSPATADESTWPSDSDIIASYEGGQVTVAAVSARLKLLESQHAASGNPLPREQMDYQPPYQRGGGSLIESVARALAAEQILTDEAGKRGLDRSPLYQLKARLTQRQVWAEGLARALEAETRQLHISDEQVREVLEREGGIYSRAREIEAGRLRLPIARNPAAAHQKAGQILRRLEGGDSYQQVMESLVREGALVDGGREARIRRWPLTTWQEVGEVVPTLLRLGPGQISEPFEHGDALELVWMSRVIPGPDYSRERAEAAVRDDLRYREFRRRMVELVERAEEMFPVRGAGMGGEVILAGSDLEVKTSTRPGEEVDESPAPKAAIEMGTLRLTLEEVDLLAAERGLPARDVRSLWQALRVEMGDRLFLGEYARSLGYDRLPHVREVMRAALQELLIRQMRQMLIREHLAGLGFDEERVREIYERSFDLYEDAEIEHEVLRVRVAPTAEGADQPSEGTRLAARSYAEELLRRARRGESLELLAGEDPDGLEYKGVYRRLVQPGSALEALVEAARPGDLLDQPLAEYGEFYVIRLLSVQPRRKLPLEAARGYILHALRREREEEIRSYFDDLLLAERRFHFLARVAEKMQR